MSDNYQAVYDAVRSRFHQPDLESIARNCWDISFAVDRVMQEYLQAAYEQQRPSVLFKPDIRPDGNMWIALYGEDLQMGIVGVGETPAAAMYDFDKNFNTQKLEARKP